MKLNGSFEIHAPRERVFHLLLDPDVLRRCIPGCESLEATSENHYSVRLRAGVGAIKGIFTGSVKIDEITAPTSFKMVVEGKGQPGFLKGSAIIELAQNEVITLLTFAADVNVGGTIASVGQRMIQGASKMMATQFFTALEAEARAVGANEPPPTHGFFRTALRWFSGMLRRLFRRS
jgi:hypothetical protein